MVWSQDSSTIYVASSQSETAELYAVDVKTGKARKIADLGRDLELRVGISFCLTATLAADGKSFLTSAWINRSDLWILEGFPQPGRRRPR
jgi:Tol biopolymer transport system component